MHLFPLGLERMVPLVRERMQHHLFEYRPEDDDPVGTIPQSPVGNVNRPDQRRRYEWALGPPGKGLDALPDELGGIAPPIP